jgi:hypothetical protein
MALERIGGVMIYDVADPADSFNFSSFEGDGGSDGAPVADRVPTATLLLPVFEVGLTPISESVSDETKDTFDFDFSNVEDSGPTTLFSVRNGTDELDDGDLAQSYVTTSFHALDLFDAPDFATSDFDFII